MPSSFRQFKDEARRDGNTRLYDPNKDYRLYTNASDQSIGVCLRRRKKLKSQFISYPINDTSDKVVNHREGVLCNTLRPLKTKPLSS